MEKKKFKDTKLFATIKQVAPAALDTITDIAATVYPPLGVVNTLVDSALGIATEEGNADGITMLAKEQEGYSNELELYYADLANARDMYKNTDHKQADKIADSVMKYNLIIIIAMVAIQVYVIMNVEGQIAAVITGIVGTITGALINERSTVVNFFFGSSMGSKDKDNK